METFEIIYNIKDGDYWKIGETITMSINARKGKKMWNKIEEKFLNIDNYREKILIGELKIVSITYQ